MEMLEHVPDPGSVVRACSQLVKPGGWVFFSTINRNPKSFLFAIVGAEYVLNLLPRGTHEYLKFIRPSELAAYCRAAGLELVHTRGMEYNPLTRRYWLSGDTGVNYMFATAEGLMFSDIRAVLFDLDGTLIDSAPDLGAAADKMRIDRGLPSLPLERYRPMAGAGARGMLGVAFGITPEHPDYAALAGGVLRQLRELHDGAHLCVRGHCRTHRPIAGPGPGLGRGHEQVDALHRTR